MYEKFLLSSIRENKDILKQFVIAVPTVNRFAIGNKGVFKMLDTLKGTPTFKRVVLFVKENQLALYKKNYPEYSFVTLANENTRGDSRKQIIKWCSSRNLKVIMLDDDVSKLQLIKRKSTKECVEFKRDEEWSEYYVDLFRHLMLVSYEAFNRGYVMLGCKSRVFFHSGNANEVLVQEKSNFIKKVFIIDSTKYPLKTHVGHMPISDDVMMSINCLQARKPIGEVRSVIYDVHNWDSTVMLRGEERIEKIPKVVKEVLNIYDMPEESVTFKKNKGGDILPTIRVTVKDKTDSMEVGDVYE